MTCARNKSLIRSEIRRHIRFETKRKISFPFPFVIILLCMTVHITHVTLSSCRVFHHSSRALEILWEDTGFIFLLLN